MEISNQKLNELTELSYIRGQRSALIQQLHSVLRELSIPYSDIDKAPENLMTIASLTIEREDAISALRTLCTTHGDNKWDNDLRLSDIIYKHLGVYLNQK